MERLVIKGPNRLSGTIKVSGAKNASLPIMAASLLTEGPVYLRRVPDLIDVRIETRLLQRIGADIQVANDLMVINGAGKLEPEVPVDLAQQLRYSLLMLGVLLARRGEVKVPLPGGCSIGARKFDMHLESLQAMGATIEVNDEAIQARAPKGLKGANIEFYYPTFSGTMNIMIAAALADGVTTIRNAAINPEVVDFSHFLQKMGAEIDGVGTRVLTIRGRELLHGCRHSIMADRIETATYLIAATITQGDVMVDGCNPEYIGEEISKLKAAGALIERAESGIHVIGPERLQAVFITTSAYPGFHTDVQPFFSTLMTLADGRSVIKETILEDRFNHLKELEKMGAKIEIEEGNFICVNGKRGEIAIIDGVDELSGAQVRCHDLRGGAALVLAGLAARGETVIENTNSVDRGYEIIDKKLSGLGADIHRVRD